MKNSTQTIIFPEQPADDDNADVHRLYTTSHGSFGPGVCMTQTYIAVQGQ